jgi:hypothetical protein
MQAGAKTRGKNKATTTATFRILILFARIGEKSANKIRNGLAALGVCRTYREALQILAQESSDRLLG